MQTAYYERETVAADGAAPRHKAPIANISVVLNAGGYCERETVAADGAVPRHRAPSAISV